MNHFKGSQLKVDSNWPLFFHIHDTMELPPFHWKSWVKHTSLSKTPTASRHSTKSQIIQPHYVSKLILTTIFKMPVFFKCLDLNNYQDSHLWNLAIIRNLFYDFYQPDRTYHVIWGPKHHPSHIKNDPNESQWKEGDCINYALLLVQKYTHSTPSKEDSTQQTKKFYQLCKPEGSEYCFSIPSEYLAPLALLNASIFNIIEYVSETDPGQENQEKYVVNLHRLNYMLGLRELFFHEVLVSHHLKTMCLSWCSVALHEWTH
ncbi:hypothetical protein M422DRAFT_247379 [Sphaerobolus stellatus SS14]|nr:hypothetical protein M422DRAFT_247379 [Sphaerobolus stellatus SS14]